MNHWEKLQAPDDYLVAANWTEGVSVNAGEAPTAWVAGNWMYTLGLTTGVFSVWHRPDAGSRFTGMETGGALQTADEARQFVAERERQLMA